MNEIEHTKRPWKEIRHDHWGVEIGVPCDDGFGHLPVAKVDSNNTEADAGLIKAAPVSYQVCRLFLEARNCFRSGEGCKAEEKMAEAEELAREALDIVRGQE